MSYTRSRQADTSVFVSGRYWLPTSGRWISKSSKSTGWRTCEDVVGNRQGINALEIVDAGAEHIIIDGITKNGIIYESVPTTAGEYGPPVHAFQAQIGGSESDSLALQAVAATNVNRPVVSLPTNIGELRDLPGLIRSFGKDHLLRIKQYRSGSAFGRELSERHLQYAFGIRQMTSDLWKLANFAGHVERRLRYVERLAAGEKVHTSTTLSQQSSFSLAGDVTVWNTAGVTVKAGSRYTSHTQKTWATVEWELDTDLTPHLPISTRLDRYNATISTCYGITPQNMGITAWELVPWSWLIDWFAGVGDMLDAVQNTIPVKSSRISLMRRTDTHERSVGCYFLPKDQQIKLSGMWHRWRITKVRTPKLSYSPITLSGLPLLEAGSLSILGSLAVTKRLRRSD